VLAHHSLFSTDVSEGAHSTCQKRKL